MEQVKKDKRQKIIAIGKEMAIYIAIFVVVVILAPKYVYSKSIVDGQSMEATLHDEDLLIQEKISYYIHEPKRFDVVVFRSPVYPKEYWVKRIIGLPGETVQIKDGKVFINNKELTDDIYGNGPIDICGVAQKPYLVPSGEYFVMGDNRMGEGSWDSRAQDVGTIKRGAIQGKVAVRVYPFRSAGVIK